MATSFFLLYIVEYIQGLGKEESNEPNEETIAAIEELKNGIRECFDTLDELWKSLEE